MAYVPVKSWSEYNVPDNFNITTKEFAIGGKLVTSKVSIPEFQAERYEATDIKKMLLDQLVQYILENNLAEFTKIPDLYSGNTTYISRMYIAPNEQVKILRMASK